MWRFIAKRAILYEKIKFLQLVRWEKAFIEQEFADILSKDIPYLRKEMAKLKAINKPDKDTEFKIGKLDTEITEYLQYENMIQKSEQKIKDLDGQIKLFKKFIWY